MHGLSSLAKTLSLNSASLMIRTRGKNKGEHLTICQFANDWISADTDDGESMIVNPTSVLLEPGEAQIFLNDGTASGMFWAEYKLKDDLTGFTRKERMPR